MSNGGWKVLYVGDKRLLSGWLKRVFEHSELFMVVSSVDEARELIESRKFDLLVIELEKFRSGSDTGLIDFARDKHPDIDVICIKALDSRRRAPESERLLMGIYWNASRLDELVRADIFWGVTHASDFFSLLQAISLAGKSVMLSIHSDKVSGAVFIENGVVTHAEAGDIEGKEAFFLLTSLKGGLFYVEEEVFPEKKTINESLDSLLIQAISRQEEIEQPFYVILKNIMLQMPSGVVWGAVVSGSDYKIIGAIGEGEKGPIIEIVERLFSNIKDIIGTVSKATFEFENYTVTAVRVNPELYVVLAFEGNPALVEFLLSRVVSSSTFLS